MVHGPVSGRFTFCYFADFERFLLKICAIVVLWDIATPLSYDPSTQIVNLLSLLSVCRTCISLHNLCIGHGDLGEWLEYVEPPHEVQDEIPADNHDQVMDQRRRDGRDRRNAIVRLYE